MQKHEEEQAPTNNLRAEFQSQWQINVLTISTTIQFPNEFSKVTKLATWVRTIV
jgi:hypothetical protein